MNDNRKIRLLCLYKSNHIKIMSKRKIKNVFLYLQYLKIVMLGTLYYSNTPFPCSIVLS